MTTSVDNGRVCGKDLKVTYGAQFATVPLVITAVVFYILC